MAAHPRISAVAAAVLLACALASPNADAQEVDIGHKLPGTLGLEAGMVPDPGLYLTSRVLGFRADEAMDRNGHALPVGLRLGAGALGLGAGFSLEVPAIATDVGASIGISLARVFGHTDRPQASLDRFGLGDLSIEPIDLGWRLSRVEIVASYGLYVPTGRYEAGGNDGVGLGQWTHEISFGGTIYFDRAKAFYLSALGSYEFNSRKRGIDITRGSTLDVQGGAGAKITSTLDVGLASYALWQVSDDRGADVPAVLRGARDRTFGLGPEINLRVPSLRSRLTARYEHDFAAESRPQGQLLVLSVTVAAWKPARH
jgi:hypothetical protein